MATIKNLSLITTIISGMLLPFSIFKNFTSFAVIFIIFIIAAIITKICKIIINEKIIDNEYDRRFSK